MGYDRMYMGVVCGLYIALEAAPAVMLHGQHSSWDWRSSVMTSTRLLLLLFVENINSWNHNMFAAEKYQHLTRLLCCCKRPFCHCPVVEILGILKL